MSENKNLLEELLSTLKQQKDELALKAHLGSMETKDELEKLSAKFDRLASDFEPTKGAVEESAGEVWKSMKQVADELKNGFERIRKSL